MNIEALAKDIKIGIENYSEKQIHDKFIEFATFVLNQHLQQEKQSKLYKMEEAIQKGASPRPALICKVGTKNFEPQHIEVYIRNISDSLGKIVPYNEYLILIVPNNDSSSVSFEILNPTELGDENQKVFMGKMDKLEKIFIENFKKTL